MGINRAIDRLGLAFALLFVLLGARAIWVQVIVGPRLAADVHNPRRLLVDPYRGDIIARDGTVLAHSAAAGRSYPYGPVYAHAVGYASQRYGRSGLEAAFDRELSATAQPRDPLSQLLGLLSGPRTASAIRGSDVVTTLDPATQSALYESLSRYPRGAGVVLDSRSGEVLALVSVPAFDPATLDADFAALSHDPASPLLDRATDGLYPPGSTFKVFTAAAALDSGVISPSDTFEDNGALAVGSFVVNDNEGEATGTQDLAGAFALSSNVDFAQIALRLGVDRWFDYADRFALGRSMRFTLPAAADHLPARAAVTPSILAQLSFGQADLAVSVLRMALVTATIASAGTQPQPVLVRAVRPREGELVRTAQGSLGSPISAQTANEVRDLMVASVQRGTGAAAALPGVQVAGKTGTATNPAGRSHAWFVAFAPAEAPRIAVAIVVENSGYGGVVAAPIVRRVLAVALKRDAS
jgi:penicillin-binding protein A